MLLVNHVFCILWVAFRSLLSHGGYLLQRLGYEVFLLEATYKDPAVILSTLLIRVLLGFMTRLNQFLQDLIILRNFRVVLLGIFMALA